MASTIAPPGMGELAERIHFNADFKLDPVEESKMPKVVVAIPAFNEEVSIGSVIVRCKKHVDEVIVIDDGSKDNTAEVAQLIGAEVVKHPVNRGYGAAIITCFETAKKKNADILVIIDADGQHNPDDIPRLIEELEVSKADIVIGSRFVNGNGKNQHIPAYRKLGMKVLDTATNASVGLKVSDSQSGFRAYSKKALKCISLTNSDMGVGSEILIKAAENHLNITEIPIKVRYDLEDTSSKNPISHGLGVFNNIIGFISQKRPMLFFCVPGAFLMGFGTIFVFMFMTIFNETHSLHIEYGIGAALFIILGMLFVSTGLTLKSIQSLRLR